MEKSRIVPAGEWRQARDEVLRAAKEVTRAQDAPAALHRPRRPPFGWIISSLA